MAERRGHDRSVQFEHAFDRLLAVKLEQVYRILVPERVRAIGADQGVRVRIPTKSLGQSNMMSSDVPR
jgi:hypothetical protein